MRDNLIKTLPALVVCAGLFLTGCGGSNDSSTTGDTPTAQTQTADALTADQGTESGESQTGDDTSESAGATHSESSVEEFYASVIDMFRGSDIDGLCSVTTEVAVASIASQLQAQGVAGDLGCTDVFEFMVANTPEYALSDPVTVIKVEGDTATLMSGDDPWRLAWVDGGWAIAGMY